MQELYSDDTWRIVDEHATLPDGRVKRASRVYRCDVVGILAFPSDEEILLIREYRPFYGDYVWMLPTGRVDKETDILDAAQRELREETGFRAEEIRHYCSTNAAESFASTNHLFIARQLLEDPLPQDDHEMIEVHQFPIDEAIERVLSSPVVHTASAYALLRFARECA